MAKRKASTSDSAAPGEMAAGSRASGPPVKDQAAIDAMIKEQREYLIAASGLEPEMLPPPPPKKSKTTKSSKTKAKGEESGADQVSDAKTGESDSETPRNAAKPKSKSLKRQASDTLDTTESPEGQKSAESYHDSGDELAPPAKKPKAPSKKRKVTASEDQTTATLPDGQEVSTTPAPEKPATKKRKTVTQGPAAVSPEGIDAEDEAWPPTKKPKRATPKPPRKGKGKANDEAAVNAAPPPPPPPPKELNSILAAKVKRVQDFIDTFPENDTKLSRNPSNSHLISIPELTVLGTLLRMRADYEISDGYAVHLADIEESIVDGFTAPIRQNLDQPWVTIDADKRTDFEDGIQDKIGGHGLDDYNLLELELEMQARPAEPVEEMPSAPAELRAFYDATLRKVLDAQEAAKARKASAEGADVGEEAEAKEADAETLTVGGESKDVAKSQEPEVVMAANEKKLDHERHRRGVCPPPMMAV